MSEGLSAAEIAIISVLFGVVVVLLITIAYKVFTGRKRRHLINLMEEANKQRIADIKQPTEEDLETKGSKNDKASSGEPEQDNEHPSMNAEQIIQNVFAPDTNDRMVRRRKINKVIKKQSSSLTS